MSISAIPKGATPLPRGEAKRSAGDDSSGAGPSFGETLLDMIGQALTPRGDGRGDGGVMSPKAEMFDEHGFFDRSAIVGPDPSSTPAEPSALPPMAVVVPPRLPGADEPPLSVVVAAGLATPLSSTPAETGIAHDPGVGPNEPNSAAPDLAAAGSLDLLPFEPLRDRSMDIAASAAGARAAPKRAAPAQSTSRLNVTLDRNETGVTVSVTADIDPQADETDIREAVSHMLSRHGLALSELRVNRRPGGDQGRK